MSNRVRAVFAALHAFGWPGHHPRPIATAEERCLALKESLCLENTTILNVTYISGPTTVDTPGSCVSTTPVSEALCRVYFVTNTTSTSAVHAEAWLPDVWYGRFLGLGNAQVGGCIDYADLDYGASLSFATVGTDNGHDGNTGLPFLNHPEVINDFAWRAVHTEVVIGKQLVEAYYGRPAAKSYYQGCSTGGRQGIREALQFPDDFDGILAGSPAVDWNYLLGWAGLLSVYAGAPTGTSSPSFLTTDDWALVSAEVLAQCDNLGVGFLLEPNNCNFDATPLLCPNATATNCLTADQVTAVTQVFSPILDTNGTLLFPQYDVGAEADSLAPLTLGGSFFPFTSAWEQYAIMNTSVSPNYTNYSLANVKQMQQINAGNIETWSGDLSAFKARGGKLLTFHGRRDPLIASASSKRLYNLITDTLKVSTLDDFYRLFLVPAMGHCSHGIADAPTTFGQGTFAGSNLVNDSDHNILLALVDWVEKGVAPQTIIGTSLTNLTVQRPHCRYPAQISVYDETTGVWSCEDGQY